MTYAVGRASVVVDMTCAVGMASVCSESLI